MSFIIKPISGMMTKDLDTFSKMDPYVIIKIGNQKQRSKTHQGGGKKPQWMDTFAFQAKGDQMMKVQVWDQDALSDDLIGQGTYDLRQLYNFPNRTQNQYIDLFRKGKSSGRILISLEYRGQSSQGNQGWNNGPNSGWNNMPNNGWGNNPNNNGWGNGPNGPINNGWNNQSNNGWNNQPNNGWGNGPNNGWGNGPNNGWGNGPNNGWGNNPNNGWGNGPNNNGWNNQPNNNGWGNNNNGWGNNNGW